MKGPPHPEFSSHSVLRLEPVIALETTGEARIDCVLAVDHRGNQVDGLVAPALRAARYPFVAAESDAGRRRLARRRRVAHVWRDVGYLCWPSKKRLPGWWPGATFGAEDAYFAIL